MLVKSASQQINVSGEGLAIHKGPYTLPSWGHWPPQDQPQASGWSSSIWRAVRGWSCCCLLPIQWRKHTENKEIYETSTIQRKFSQTLRDTIAKILIFVVLKCPQCAQWIIIQEVNRRQKDNLMRLWLKINAILALEIATYTVVKANNVFDFVTEKST